MLRPFLAAVRVACILAGLACTLPSWAQNADSLPTIELSAGIHLIHAEVADSDMLRMRGLMFRDGLAPNHGMLFLFDDTDKHCMWMRNTLIPLSVAFIADDGTIVNVEEMKPQTDTTHCAGKPVHVALEMDTGWFAKHGIGTGAQIRGIPATKH
jgi:uncharacterized membrane protein (UPF0127 family)